MKKEMCSLPKCKELAVIRLWVTDPPPLGVHRLGFCLHHGPLYRTLGYRETR